MKRLIGCFCLAYSLLAARRSAAADASAILAAVDRYRTPLDSFSMDVELTSYAGQSSETSKFRVYGKGNDKSVVEFVAPAADKGRYLLMLRDAMWIYLPSASRPIRISPLQRLMGQASNGDVARTGFTADYDARSVAADGELWVLELEAKDPSLAYKRIQLWVDKATGEPRRADFHVVSGKLIKRAWYRQYGEMSGRRMVTAIEIEDLLRSGHRTIMRYANLVPRNNPDKMFTRDALGKW